MYFDPVACGKRIKELRIYRNLTQEQFAEQLHIYFVCNIFSSYLSGQNTLEIAERLNCLRTDYPALGKRQWNSMAITRILRNEKYIGDSLWQKSYRTDTLPTKELRNRGQQEQYYAECTHPAIIEREIFTKAQELLSGRQIARPVSPIRPSPLQSITVCGICGALLRRKQVNGNAYFSCRMHDSNSALCVLPPIPERELRSAFLRLYYNLKHHGTPILSQMLTNLQAIRNRRMLWSLDAIELNKQISDLSSQNQMLTLLKQQGLIDSDIFISQSNALAEQLRAAKLEKERLLKAEGDETIAQTRELLDILNEAPDFLDAFDEELFRELIDKIIVDSNEQLRFRLKNGLELPEHIERTVR